MQLSSWRWTTSPPYDAHSVEVTEREWATPRVRIVHARMSGQQCGCSLEIAAFLEHPERCHEYAQELRRQQYPNGVGYFSVDTSVTPTHANDGQLAAVTPA